MQAGLCIAAGSDYQGPWVSSSQERKTRNSKKGFHGQDVNMDPGTAASKVNLAGQLQAAIQASKKSGCHPQSVVTLSKLQADKGDIEVH